MKFTKTEPDENFDVLRCISETGKWEIGIRRVLYGLNICGNPVHDDCYSFHYPAGDNRGFALVLFATVFRILERYPEDVTLKQIQQDFPKYEVQPIDKDPYCWKRLQEMAEEEEIAYEIYQN